MMTRFSLLLALVSLLTWSAQAQVSIGASVGANYSFWDWHIKNINTDLDFGPGFGYRAAVVADWHISPAIGLRADLAYQIWRNSTTLMVTFPSDPNEVEGTGSERYHNFAGSLLLRVSPFQQKNVYFLAGATAAHITEARRTVTIDGGPEAGTHDQGSIDLENFNRTQVFADFGGGVKFPLGAKGSLFGEVRYQLPLTNLSGIDNVDASVNTLLLNVGYLFQL
jgi:prepilin-type processing-associated H-X9-DG protein